MKWIDAKMKVSVSYLWSCHFHPVGVSLGQLKQQSCALERNSENTGASFCLCVQELGVTDNPNYKITFMLDSAAMITVHTPKRGVVEVGVLSMTAAGSLPIKKKFSEREWYSHPYSGSGGV